MEFTYVLNLFHSCYIWNSQLIQITKNKKTCYKDFGTYELKHLPEKGSVLEQNNKLMNGLNYVRHLMQDLNNKANG